MLVGTFDWRMTSLVKKNKWVNKLKDVGRVEGFQQARNDMGVQVAELGVELVSPEMGGIT